MSPFPLGLPVDRLLIDRFAVLKALEGYDCVLLCSLAGCPALQVLLVLVGKSV